MQRSLFYFLLFPGFSVYKVRDMQIAIAASASVVLVVERGILFNEGMLLGFFFLVI